MTNERFVVTPAQMKLAEENSERKGVSCAALMENAGEKIADEMNRRYGTFGKTAVILCGSGNNGGDGFALAKQLCRQGAQPHIVIVGESPKTPLAKDSFERNEGYFLSELYYEKAPEAVNELAEKADFIADCVYGTGFRGELSDSVQRLFALCGKSNAVKIAADIPSGCNALDGSASEGAFRADITLALGAVKTGHILPPASVLSGEIIPLDIGIASECYTEYEARLSGEAMLSGVPARPRISHKGNYGRLLNIAGSESYIGAAWLSTNAAIKTGAGIVTLCSHKSVTRTVAATLHECTFAPCDADGLVKTALSAAQNATAITVGCGLGNNAETAQLTARLCESAECPIIIDADGINSIAEHKIKLKDNGTILLTPHPAEFSRLSGLDTEYILKNKLTAARQYAVANGVYILLKDAYSVLAAPDGRVFVNMTGNAGLARGGSGDTLTGTIGGFAAQGTDLCEAARLGAYLLGLAAQRLAERLDLSAILPSMLPDVYSDILRENRPS